MLAWGLKEETRECEEAAKYFFSGEDSGRWRIGIPTVEGVGEEEYHELQLADLGALNAALAVGIWRRHIGQYEAEERDWLIRYRIENNDLLKKTAQS